MPVKQIMYDDVDLFSKRSLNRGGLTGLTTGFKDLDNKLGGLQKSNLVVVAARPAMGKTAFALNIALNAAEKAKANVLIFDLEMSREELGQRLISERGNIYMEDLSKGSIQGDTWNDIILASEAVGKCNINIDVTTDLTMYKIRNKCRRMKANQGLDLIVVDYLQQLVTKADNVVNEVGQLSRQFKLLAMEMDCPVLLLSQLHRLPKDRKKPEMSDLRDSGSIEQDADVVLLLHRDDYYDPGSNPGVCEINIAKHRNGPTGTVELTWVARYTKFSDRAIDG